VVCRSRRDQGIVCPDSYLPYEGKVVIRNKGASGVAIRVPSWVDARTLRCDLDGVRCEPDRIGRYLNVHGLPIDAVLTLTFPVTEKSMTYTVNANTQWEQQYTCQFRGSTLVDISPRDQAATSYPLYQRSHMRRTVTPMRQVQRFVPTRMVYRW
jgi:hypothetical protein